MAKEVQIGDILKRIKRPISLIDDQEYKLVTIRMNHKGVVLREKKQGALIKSGMYEVRPGDFILSGIDARNGAFGIVPKELDGAIVTNDFWYFEINGQIISKELFLELTATTWFDEICKRGSDGTTQRIRLQSDKFFNQTILLPELEEQTGLLSKIHLIKEKHGILIKEIESQKSLLAQLKQSILQETIQGKLTEEWRELRQAQHPSLEPASELVKRIQVEKARLIKERKIKKEKSLPPITDSEKPFELPEGWVWCRLGEILLFSDSGKSPKCEKRPAHLNEWGVLTTTAIQAGIFREEANKVLPMKFKIDISQKVGLNDVLITRAGPLNRTGVACKVKSISRQLILSDKTIRLKHPAEFISPDFLVVGLNSQIIRGLLIPKMTGMAESQVNISQPNIQQIPFPVPPFDEQKAIVEKVESLMEKCRALVEEISQSEQHAQMLMQAVLKEAFEG